MPVRVSMISIIANYERHQGHRMGNKIALLSGIENPVRIMPPETIYQEDLTGLKAEEVLEVRRQYGQNIFQGGRRGGFLRSLWDILKEPMFILLMTASFLYFLLGEQGQGWMMLAAMVLVAAISLYQEVKSSRALAALKKYTEPTIKVIRDGKQQVIPSEDIVPGDIMVLGEGERVPADAVILHSNDLSINEAVITGESMPVEKNDHPGSNNLFQGTTLNSGMCYAKVTHIGNDTKLGRLGKSIEAIPVAPTLLQTQISRFIRIMAVFGLTAFGTIWLVNYWHTGEVAHSLLLGLTLAMSAIPEEVPVAFSSFMALGAYRMAKLGIIARQPQTIENLGMVSVICLDKTGTLTENRMEVRSVFDFRTGLSENLQDGKTLLNTGVLWWARLACEADPFDAMEKAIVSAYSSHFKISDYGALSMVHEYALGGQPPMMTHVYEKGGRRLVAAKGAPERIVRVCKLDLGTAAQLRQRITGLAAAGFRVLGVCSAQGHEGAYPVDQDNFNWQFEGLVALYDPPKKNVTEVIAQWRQAGIEVKVLSGDYPETVLNIARQAGIPGQEKFLTGEEVNNYSPERLRQEVRTVSIYARMFPDAKLKVIDALKANGNIVAMTGDGVNDGPALQAAHIGIAMGDKGTDIAREAADLIVSDDNLGRITEAIQHGRTIHHNIKKAIRYLISIHIPIILTASLPLLLGWKFPTIFSPIHIIFLELIMGPTCSIFYEREPGEKGIMKRPPHPGGEKLFRGRELAVALSLGMATATGLLGIYFYFMQHGYSLQYTRTVVFISLVISNVLLTFMGRSLKETFLVTIRYPNNLVPVILVLSVSFFAFLYFVPFARRIFELSTLSGWHVLAAMGTALVSTGWFEIYKILRNRSTSKKI